MGLQELIRYQVEQVKFGVTSQSPNYKLLEVQKPKIDQTSGKVTLNMLFKYNSMPIVFTIDNYVKNVNREAIQKSLDDLTKIVSQLSRNLAMYFDYKVANNKVYSIMYNSGRMFHFIIPVKYTSARYIGYDINIRKNNGVIYSNSLMFTNGQIILRNSMVKLNNSFFSNIDKLTITLTQNLTSTVFLNLVQNQLATNLVTFFSEVFRGLNYASYMDKNFVGTMNLLLRIKYTSRGFEPGSVLTISKGGISYSVPVPAIINMYKSLNYENKNEKLKQIIIKLYTNKNQ